MPLKLCLRNRFFISSILVLSLFCTLIYPNHLKAERNRAADLPKHIIYASDEHNFVWFIVYKVASLTVKQLLETQVSDLVAFRPYRLPAKYKHHFKFAFVRNTWDRIVSCYHHRVLTKQTEAFRECFDKDFDYFIDFISRLDVKTSDPHLRLQTRLIPVHQCDFIGRLDNFSNDIKHVCKKIGVECPKELPKIHKTNHKHYSKYYTKRTRNIIAWKYYEEIMRFGFEFESKL